MIEDTFTVKKIIKARLIIRGGKVVEKHVEVFDGDDAVQELASYIGDEEE